MLNLAIGILGGLITALILRFTTHILEYVPRRLYSLGIGTSFERFSVNDPGDTYSSILRISIRNHGGEPL